MITVRRKTVYTQNKKRKIGLRVNKLELVSISSDARHVTHVEERRRKHVLAPYPMGGVDPCWSSSSSLEHSLLLLVLILLESTALLCCPSKQRCSKLSTQDCRACNFSACSLIMLRNRLISSCF